MPLRMGISVEFLDKITSAGFKIVAINTRKLSRRDAQAFYAVHKGASFFGELVDFYD